MSQDTDRQKGEQPMGAPDLYRQDDQMFGVRHSDQARRMVQLDSSVGDLAAFVARELAVVGSDFFLDVEVDPEHGERSCVLIVAPRAGVSFSRLDASIDSFFENHSDRIAASPFTFVVAPRI